MLGGLAISAAFGAWHFFIPYLFRWYSYIPDAPRNLVVSMDWTNLFLSLLLCGVSVLLIVLTAIYPWSYDWMFAAQITAFTIVFVLLVLPLPRLLGRGSRSES